MSKVIITHKLLIELGRMLGEDYKRFGSNVFNVGNAEGLFSEAFMDLAKAEHFDNDLEFFVAEEDAVIDFLKGVKPTADARRVGDISHPGTRLFVDLLGRAKERAEKACDKFPQPNYVLNKFSEESGEVVKEVIHYTEGRGQWSRVEDEIVDTLAMIMRLLKEGDGIIKFVPPYLEPVTKELSDD